MSAPRYILVEVRGIQGESFLPQAALIETAARILRKALHDTAEAHDLDCADIVITSDRPYYSGQAATADYADVKAIFGRVMDWAKEMRDRTHR